MTTRVLLALLELVGLLVFAAMPSDLPRLGAFLFVVSRWAIFFVARGANRDLLSSICQAVVPWLGWLWLEFGARVASLAVSKDSGGHDPANDPLEKEGEPAPEELLQLNVQLMSSALSNELSGSSKRSQSVSPLVDVANGADYRTKQRVVIQLRELRTLKGVEALKVLRGQLDPDLQYLAATALASLEQLENSIIAAGEERVLEMPRDLTARLAVARSRVFLCKTGLLAGSMASAHLERAEIHLHEAKNFARVAAERREAAEAWAEVVELLGRPAEAAAALRALPDLSTTGLERLAGLQLASGRADELWETCRRIIATVPATDPLHEAAVARLAASGGGSA